MSVNESILNKTQNYYRCIGYLYETSLKRESCEIKLKDEQGKSSGTTAGERILGNIAVKTDNGIHTFNVYAQNLTSKGEESKQWKMFCDMLNWNPKINGEIGVEPTLVNVEGSVGINDYINQRGEISSVLRWRVSRANTKATLEEAKGTTLKATLYINSISPEIRQEEETGRLLVSLYGAENNGTCFPINAIVNEDMADDFESCYEVGMTVPFEFELVSRHVGGENKENNKKFGRSGKIAVNEGFDIQELILVGGDEEIEEPDELIVEDENGNELEVKTQWINPVAMKKAIKVRAQMLEQMKKNPLKQEEKPKSVKAAKQTQKDRMKAGMKTGNVPEFEDFEDEDIF